MGARATTRRRCAILFFVQPGVERGSRSQTSLLPLSSLAHTTPFRCLFLIYNLSYHIYQRYFMKQAIRPKSQVTDYWLHHICYHPQSSIRLNNFFVSLFKQFNFESRAFSHFTQHAFTFLNWCYRLYKEQCVNKKQHKDIIRAKLLHYVFDNIVSMQTIIY